MGKSIFKTLAVLGLGAAATLGAIRLFGAPAEIVPDDQKILQCVGTIDFDTLEETTRYKRVYGEKYGTQYTAELYEFTFGSLLEDKVEVRLMNVSDTLNDETLNLAKQKVFDLTDGGYYHSTIFIYDYEVSFVEINAYISGEREAKTWTKPVLYNENSNISELFGDLKSEHPQKIGIVDLSVSDNYMKEVEELISKYIDL